MQFKQFKKELKKNFKVLVSNATHLFEVNVDKDEMWNLYLDSHTEGTNEIYRERRQADCSACRNFIKNMGNIVAIYDNKVYTIWDFETNAAYQPVADALANFIKSHAVTDVWVNKFKKIGTDFNFEQLDEQVLEWQHLHVEIPDKLVTRSSSSEAEIRGGLRDTRNVFFRSLVEISEESLMTVLELISQNSLYKGAEWKGALTQFLAYKRAFLNLGTVSERENYAWVHSVQVGGAIGRIRNHSIGTLLVNISEGMDLDTAVKKYEVIVAPANYKRPKAVFTKKMLEEAQKTIQELGLMDELGRRYARLEDITVNNVLFSNKLAAKRMGGNIFEEMMSEVTVNPKQFARVEEISIESFLNNVLPTAQELELFLENKHANNMVSLIAPENNTGNTLFKWNNAFSWAYSGNITDSDMKENVKSAGGKVDGVLRFSTQWNDNEYDGNDLDAHCHEPGGFKIYYGNKGRLSPTGGMLDVDIIDPRRGTPAVENITWATKAKMKKGVYQFVVHNFNNRGGKSGFRAEVEFAGQVFSFDYTKALRQGEQVLVAEVYFDGVNFTIQEKLPSNVTTRDVWGLKTNQFIPVSVMTLSPNYWDEQHGIGHKHYFFMLKDCVNPENPNGFYNEFLREDLMRHKRVFEALASKMSVKDTEDQLSGLGFSSTRRNEVLVKVKGQTERVVKVKF